jgi:deoxyuridine 5'-triphosphate nucleotidohydrolase
MSAEVSIAPDPRSMSEQQLIDLRRWKVYNPRDLLVKYDPDVLWRLDYAMPGDIGLDLPIKIIGSKVKPEDFSHYIMENGDATDPKPWLEVPPCGYAELEVGVRVKLPDNTWAFITGRSSTAWKRRLLVIQGVIDEQYVGPLRTLVYNPNHVAVRVHEGDRLSQLIIIPKCHPDKIVTVDELPKTTRGELGFGSSGLGNV